MHDSDTGWTRRGVLRGTVAGAAAAVAAGTATAQSGFDGWLSDVSNYDGVHDMTGTSEVTVTVGAEGNGGAFAFAPAAIRVDPGTTVVWEWTGEGGSHNVVQEPDGAYESELVTEAGYTFSHTFESEGVSKYYCLPHRAVGMKGVVVVGDAAADAPTPTPTPTADPAGGEGAPAGGGGEGGGGGGTSAATERNVDLLFRALSGALAGAFALTIAVLGYVYGRYQAPERPAGEGAEATVSATGVTAAVEATPTRLARELGHDEFDPSGTATLLVVYFVILALMWVFMYFVEFLGGGPTIIG